MNVNHDKKLIWLTSPNTREEIVAKLFFNNGFRSLKNNDLETEELTTTNISYKTQIDEIYGTFNILVTTDNPYRRIVNLYKKNSPYNWSLKQHTKELLKNNFSTWFKNKSDVYGNLKIFDLFLDNIPLDVLKKSHIIKLDDLENEITKYDFITYDDFIMDFVKTKKRESDDFIDILTFNQAKQVYQNSKHIFDICGYDPFSFTSDSVNHKKQVHFIHNI